VRGTAPVWEEGGWRPLPSLDRPVEADVCVVGLGGSGLSAVLHLLADGQRVVGLDAGGVAGGAAGRNGGLLLAGIAAFHHDAVRELGRERAVQLYRLTERARERELNEAAGGARRTGSLRIAQDEVELADCQVQYQQMRSDGLAAELYEGSEGRGLLFPGDAVFNPLARCRALAERALAGGAALFERSPAVSFEPGLVSTPAGSVSCGAIIVAVDGRLAELLPELAGRVRTARLQMLATAPVDAPRLPRPVYRRYGFEYYQRTADGRVALGGFRDQAGAAEWTTDARPSGDVQDRLERFLRQELGVSAPITHRWAASVGFRPSGAGTDLLPLAARPRDGLWAIGGYNGTGNLVGAELGRAAAAAATGADLTAWRAWGGD
jgi:glycine/D-amino acid oxidase-like deaminating enzyme